MPLQGADDGAHRKDSDHARFDRRDGGSSLSRMRLRSYKTDPAAIPPVGTRPNAFASAVVRSCVPANGDTIDEPPMGWTPAMLPAPKGARPSSGGGLPPHGASPAA